MDNENIVDVIECHQSVIDMYKELADYEMVASQIFCYIGMESYENFFDKLAIHHFGMLGDIVEYIIYKYGMIITPKCNCEFKEMIKEYNGVKNSDLEDEDIKDMIYLLLKKEKDMLDNTLSYISDKIEHYKSEKKSYSTLQSMYKELYYLCKKMKMEMSKLKEIDYDLNIIKLNEKVYKSSINNIKKVGIRHEKV